MMMKQRHNTPTTKRSGRSLCAMTGDQNNAECKSCNEQENLICVAVIQADWDGDEEFSYSKESVMWLCEKHYTKLLKHEDYRVREMADPVEIDHSIREDSEDGHITILKKNNENKWLKVPEELELNLEEET